MSRAVGARVGGQKGVRMGFRSPTPFPYRRARPDEGPRSPQGGRRSWFNNVASRSDAGSIDSKMEDSQMRHVLVPALVGFVLLACGTAVKADITYEVTGTFGADINGTTGLAGGSFTATFQVPAGTLPVAANGEVYFDSYSVSLYNSAASLVSSFGQAVPSTNGGVADINSIVDVAFFVDPSTSGDIHFDFAVPYTGTGLVIPTNLSFGPFASFYVDGNGNLASIASGQSVAAVPEPSSAVIAAVMGLLVADRWSIAGRRKKREGQRRA